MAGKIIRKERLNKHEQSIWDALQKHSTEFTQYHGYHLDDIKKISIRKFLKMEDWRGPQDVLSFKTDVMHVSICPHCLNDFGMAEDLFGLCNSCKKLFDLKQLTDLATVLGQQATVELVRGKQLGDPEKLMIMEQAIKYAEYTLSMFIRNAAKFGPTKSDGELTDGTLLVKTAFLKDKDLVLRTENADRINDLLEAAKKVILEHLKNVYVFEPAKVTEV